MPQPHPLSKDFKPGKSRRVLPELPEGFTVTKASLASGFGLSEAQAIRFGIPYDIGPNGDIIPRRKDGKIPGGIGLAFEEGRDPTEWQVRNWRTAQERSFEELERLQKAQIQQLKIGETEAKVEAGGRARSIRKAKKSGGGSRSLLTTGTNSSSIGPRNG